MMERTLKARLGVWVYFLWSKAECLCRWTVCTVMSQLKPFFYMQ